MSGQISYDNGEAASFVTVTLLSEIPNKTFNAEEDGRFSISFHPIDAATVFRFDVRTSEGLDTHPKYKVITPGCNSEVVIVLSSNERIGHIRGRYLSGRPGISRSPTSNKGGFLRIRPRYGVEIPTPTPAPAASPPPPPPAPAPIPPAPAPTPFPTTSRLRTEGMSRPKQEAKQTPRVTATPPETSPSRPPDRDPAGDPEKRVIEDVVDKLHDGGLAVIVPPTMKQGVPVRVKVRITCQEVTVAMTEGLENSSFNQVENIRVSSTMKASLQGEEGAFKITRVNSSEEQIIAGIPFAEWEWEVIPQKWGKRTLYVSVTACLHVPDRGDKLVDIPVYGKPVEVKVSYKFVVMSFLSQASNWSYLPYWGFLLLFGKR